MAELLARPPQEPISPPTPPPFSEPRPNKPHDIEGKRKRSDDGHEDEDKDRERNVYPGRRIQLEVRGTSDVSATTAGKSGVGDKTSTPSPDDLFPDCPGVPHIDRHSWMFQDGPLPEVWPECRNPDCYMPP